ncbi:MAG: AbrB family transcriptional regulator [Pseudomonadales bacterium]
MSASLPRTRQLARTGLRVLYALTVGLAGALSCQFLQVPVPWLTGPLMSVTAGSMLFGSLATPRWVRHTGQWIVGIALGLHFAPPVVAEILRFIPWMLLGAFGALAVGTLGGMAMSRMGCMDAATSHFATALGGAPEMANAAERSGAQVDQVVTAHTLRLVFVVASVPALLALLQPACVVRQHIVAASLPSPSFLILAVVTLLLAQVAGRLSLPNAYTLVPLLVSAIVAGGGIYPVGAPPRWIGQGAQVLIATSLAGQFSRGSLRASSRLVMPVLLYSAAGVAVAVAGALQAGVLTGLPVTTLILALAPASMADMGMTAEALCLSVAVVTGFHVVRLLSVLAMTGPLFRMFRHAAVRSADK